MNNMPFDWLSKRRVMSSVLSLLLLTCALVTLWLGHWFKSQLPEVIEVREISISLPPPPPPPPSVQQELVETQLTIDIQGTGISIPKIEVTQPIIPMKPDAPTLKSHDITWQKSEMDWDAFELNELDEFPKLLTPIQITLPKSFRLKGVNRVLIKLDIVIDIDGSITLISIVENPYPELVSAIQKLATNSRFSSPTKNNEAVKARFIWPVEIKS